MTEETSPFDDVPILLLHLAASAARYQFDRELRPWGVTSIQLGVSVAIHRGLAQSPSEIADLFRINRSAATRMIDRLVKKGMVTRRQDPVDRRVQILAATPQTGELVNEMLGTIDVAGKEIMKGLDDADRKFLVETLKKLLANAERLAAHSG